MIKLIDSFNGIDNLRFKYKSNPDGLMDYWLEYMDGLEGVRDLCLKDSCDVDFDSMIKPVMVNALDSDFEDTVTAHRNFKSEMGRVEAKFNALFEMDEDIDIYFVLGLNNGAGWATVIDDRHSVVIGVEKVVELKWFDKKRIRALVFHELCHVVHSILRDEYIDIEFDLQSNRNIWQMYIEGFAQRYQLLLSDTDFYHQDDGNWLEWCKSNHELICKEYRSRIINCKPVIDFYGDWNNFQGYVDVGYYLGCEFIKSIEDKYDIQSLATLEIEELRELTLEFLLLCTDC